MLERVFFRSRLPDFSNYRTFKKKHKPRDGFDERDIFRFHLGGVLQKKQWCTENKCVSGKGHKTASRGLWRLAIKKIRGFSAAKRAKTAGFFHKNQLARSMMCFAAGAPVDFEGTTIS